MSLFRPYQYRPRPDLLSDAPVKHGFFLFWEIFYRKVWRFITINMIYFVITLPMLIFFHLIANNLYANFLDARGLTEAYLQANTVIDIFPGLGLITILATYLPSFLLIPLLVLSIFLYGPATMGMTYIFRNFAREEHAWLSDFATRGKANFKQGLFFGILDVVIVSLLTMGMIGGVTIGTGAVPFITLVLRTLSGIVFVFYFFMRNYFYMMAVTIDLNVFYIIKNAMNFAILGFGRNIWAGIVFLIAFVLSFLTVPALSLVLVPFLFYSFTGFSSVFICYPIVKKYVVLPALEQEAVKKGENSKSE